MGLLNSWYDTAGAETDKKRDMLVTAGIIATSEKWAKFDHAWMAAMAEFGVTELHMKEFAHSTGQYQHFKGNKPLRDEFLARLLAIAKRGMNKGFVVALCLADYDEVNAEYEVGEYIGSPYAVTQALCIGECIQWMHDKGLLHHFVQFFVAEGDNGQPALMRNAEKFIGWKPITLPRNEPNTGEPFTPFQLCDFVAYEHRLAYSRLNAGDRSRAMRASFRAMRRLLPIPARRMSATGLRDWCVQSGVPKRGES